MIAIKLLILWVLSCILSSRLIFYVPFSYLLFIFYLPRRTLLDFPSVSSLASLSFLSCCHRTTTKTKAWRRNNARPFTSHRAEMTLHFTSLGAEITRHIFLVECQRLSKNVCRRFYRWTILSTNSSMPRMNLPQTTRQRPNKRPDNVQIGINNTD